MAGLTQFIEGAGTYVAGQEQEKFGSKEKSRGRDKYLKQLEDFRSGKFDPKISAEMAKTKTLATGLAADATKRAADRASAQQQQLLTNRGDVRGLAAAAGQARQLELGVQQAEQTGAQTILDTQNVFGKHASEVQKDRESIEQQLEAMELARGAARFDAGRLTEFEGGQQKIKGGTQAAAGGASMISGLPVFANTGVRIPDKELFDSANKDKPKGEKLGASLEEEEELEKLRKKVEELEGSAPEVEPRDREKTDISKMLAILSAPSGRFAQGIGQRQSAGNEFMEEGGYVGEEGGVTEGEFSHEKNPIDMVNEDGDKVGEVTGGEFVFNDEQSALMKELIERNEPEMLIKFMRDLLSQPQFK